MSKRKTRSQEPQGVMSDEEESTNVLKLSKKKKSNDRSKDPSLSPRSTKSKQSRKSDTTKTKQPRDTSKNNNNVQIPEEILRDDQVIQNKTNLGDDIRILVDPKDDEQFAPEDEIDEELRDEFDEELDYEDLQQQEIDPPNTQLNNSTETVEVDSVVNFRVKCKDKGESITFANPQELQSYVSQIVEAKWKEKEERSRDCTPSTSKDRRRYGKESNDREMIKSPSDTTLYAPALNKTPDRNRNVLDRLNSSMVKTPVQRINNDMIDNISQFVDDMRFVDEQRRRQPRSEVVVPKPTGTPRRQVDDNKEPTNHEIANKLIIDVEKFQGGVQKPKGNDQFIGIFGGVRPVVDKEVIDDDEFFHVTCHVDKSLTQKIQNGEFVDLEKLLVKDRFKRRSSDERLEFVSHEGQTFLAPAQDRENRIFGLRKWEQAFRVYAAIYSKANPHRSSEIWQYIHTINTAASNYVWENVAYYDFTFRQMMSQNPYRSWSKTYNQLWNLAICTPIQKSTGNGQTSSHNNLWQNRNSHEQCPKNGNGNGLGKKINRPCWRFNKNIQCSADTCDYEHKCSYCGKFGHSVLNCHKLFSKKNDNGNKRGGKTGQGNSSNSE